MTTAYLLNLFSLMLQPPPGAPAINARALLTAIAEVESKCGAYPLQSRYEAEFRKAYVDRMNPAPWVNELRQMHGGDRIATSYGLTQIMALVAYELGMPSHRPPEDLYLPYVCLYWTVELLNKRTMPNAFLATMGMGVHRPRGGGIEQEFIEAIADAYNSGSARDGNVPSEYVNKIWKAYQEAKHG